MNRSKAVRLALLFGTTALGHSIAYGQSVAIPAGPPATAQEIDTPSTEAGAQASPLSSSDPQAQGAPETGAAGPETEEAEIVVTGTRIIANGYEAPTPVTVVSTTELLKKAPESIAAGLAKLPQFVGTSGSNVTSSQAGTPSAGNYLNLRRLGQIETLLLLDGQRLPPTSFEGTTDANIIPQALIQRVDVVTGGASAAYGSDAVAGVVNFILDTKFEGIKGNVQYGISSRGDNHQEKVSLAAGKYFMDDRLHLEASFDYFYQPGIRNNSRRPFGGDYEGGWVNVGANPLRPCPAGTCAENPFTPVFNVRLANGTYGTLINAGRSAAQAESRSGTRAFSLTGFTFDPTLPGGAVSPFGAHRADLGAITGTPNFNVGGADTAVTFGATLTSKLRTKQGFARADYDFGSVQAFLQGSYTDSDTRYVTVGAGTQFQSFQIFADNAFLPIGVRQAMQREGVAAFVASRVEADQYPKEVLTNNKAMTVLGGFRGRLADYRWNLNFSHGESDLSTRHFGNFNQPRWFAALDAVDEGQFRTGTANGNIVCRMDLTNPGLFPGCKPWNPFGNGSPSAESYSYFQDEPSRYQVSNKQTAVAANLSGSLFELPAGPISFAVGGEVRRQKLRQTSNVDPSDPIELYEPGLVENAPPATWMLNGIPEGLRTAAVPFNLLWNSTNVGKAFGKQTIKEGYVELAVPILRDTPFFHALDINGAARYVDYSVSGAIWAWKVGASWQPIEELRLRGTWSQDIRAPTLYELFQGIGSTRGTFTDIHTGANTNLITLNSGNPDLKSEKARTITAGAIFQPRFFPGFSVSVDYYKIRIKDQITRPNTATVNQLCEDSNGTGPTCALIVRPFPFSDRRPENFPLTITTVPFNQASLKTEGIDYELNYRTRIGTGELDLRLLGNHTRKFVASSAPGALPTFLAGAAAGVPKNRFTASVDYSDGPFSVGVDVRYIGTLYYTKQPNVFVTNNRLSPVAYLNANISYDIVEGKRPVTLYLSGTNLTDKFVFAPQNNAQPTEFYPSFQSQYDVVGRYFVTGIRFRI
jgi:outer membrane receptor protein involved in Fe transport